MTEYVKIPKEEYTDLIELIEKDAQIIKEFYFEIQKLQQEKQDLKEWLESSKYIDVTFCLNGTTKEYRVGYNEAIEQVLERLG